MLKSYSESVATIHWLVNLSWRCGQTSVDDVFWLPDLCWRRFTIHTRSIIRTFLLNISLLTELLSCLVRLFRQKNVYAQLLIQHRSQCSEHLCLQSKLVSNALEIIPILLKLEFVGLPSSGLMVRRRHLIVLLKVNLKSGNSCAVRSVPFATLTSLNACWIFSKVQ